MIRPNLMNVDTLKSESSRQFKKTRDLNDSTKDVRRLSNLILKGSDSRIKIESIKKDI